MKPNWKEYYNPRKLQICIMEVMKMPNQNIAHINFKDELFWAQALYFAVALKHIGVPGETLAKELERERSQLYKFIDNHAGDDAFEQEYKEVVKLYYGDAILTEPMNWAERTIAKQKEEELQKSNK